MVKVTGVAKSILDSHSLHIYTLLRERARTHKNLISNIVCKNTKQKCVHMLYVKTSWIF